MAHSTRDRAPSPALKRRDQNLKSRFAESVFCPAPVAVPWSRMIPRELQPLLAGGLWGGVALLVIIGLAAVAGRAVFTADLAARAQPIREQALGALHRDDPHMAERARDVDLVDRRFAAHPFVTLLHVIPGGLFLLLAPLQFFERIRRGHVRLHRWSGRSLVPLAFVSAASGLYFGLLMPYGGVGEATAIALFGGIFLTAVSRAFLAIRGRQVARHREWMIRAFAIAIGTSTVRLVALVLDLTITPAGFAPRDAFVLSIWTGWALTLGAAELWISYTRPLAQTPAVPVSVV